MPRRTGEVVVTRLRRAPHRAPAHRLWCLAALILCAACGGGPTGVCYRPQVIQVDTLWFVGAEGDSTRAIVEWRVCNGNGGRL